MALSLALTLQACGGGSNNNNNSTANFSISADASSITFSNEFLQVSDDTFQVNVNYRGNGLLLGYAPGAQAVGWLNFTTKSVTETSAVIEVKVINAENIVADLYQTKIRLSTGDVNEVNLVHHDIDVSLLIWQLTADKERISFDATLGDTTVAEQTLSITSESNNTWTASVDVDWLSLDVLEGTGSGEIKLNADLSSFDTAQKHEANLTITETTTGDSKIIPIELGLDRLYLYANVANIGLTSTANVSSTSKTVSISSNSPNPIKWQAQADVNWLTTERSLDNIDQLTIATAPDIALENGVHQATITISALDAENNIDESVVPERINIAYYQTDESTSAVRLTEKSIALDSIVTSPYLPYFYTAEQNNVVVYNTYTGEQINTIAVTAEGITVDQLIMHPDGEFLLARAIETTVNEDETTTQTIHRYRVQLTDQSITKIENSDLEFQPVKYVTVSGRHFVITQTLELANDELKRIFWDRENAYFTTLVEQANTAETIYAVDPLTNSFKRYTASVNDFLQTTITLSQTHEYKPELLQEGQAISSFVVDPNDKGLYAVSPTSEWISFDGNTFTDNGLLEQNENAVTLNVAIANNGVPHYARFTQADGFYIDLYNNSQVKTNTIATLGQQPAYMSVSSDDKRLLINAALAQQIEVITINQIDVSASNITFNSTLSDPQNSVQTITVNSISENWEVTSNTDWLVISTTFDNGIGQIDVSVDTSKFTAPGSYKAKLKVYDPDSGLSTTVIVEINIDEIRLFPNEPAVSLNSLDNISHLSSTVTVLDNSQQWNGSWIANTTAEWLTLSANNDTNQLEITADPSALVNDIHHAVITIEGNDPGTNITSGTIKVSLTKMGIDSVEQTLNDVNINNNQAVFDPLRPFMYYADGDMLKVINIHDTSEVTSINSPVAGADIGNLVIHPDGSLLLFSNTENFTDDNGQAQTRNNYYQMVLETFEVTAIQSASVTIDQRYQPALIAMISGKPVVVTESQEIADLNLTSKYLDEESAFLASQFYDIKNTDNVLSFNALTNELVQRELSYNSIATNPVSLIDVKKHQNDAFASNIRDIAASKDGGDLYTASLASEWTTYDGIVFNDRGVLHNSPTVLASIKTTTDSDDNLFVYRFNAVSGFTLAKYDASQQLLWQVIHTTGSLTTFISPAYQRLISYNADTKTLTFDTLPD